MREVVGNLRKKLIKRVTKVVEKDLQGSNKYGWPPDCIGIYYQPKRPEELRKKIDS